MKLISITPATDGKHKYQATFVIDGKQKTTKFGSVGYADFTMHNDCRRRDAYLARHYTREDWTDPTSAGALSKFLLWSEPTFKTALAKYKKHFKL